MKVISVIFAVYMFGLVFAPCADAHAENNSECIVTQQTTDTHEHHADACSPFCFCNCCQTVCQPAIENYVSYFVAPLNTIIIPSKNVDNIHSFSFWRPPEV